MLSIQGDITPVLITEPFNFKTCLRIYPYQTYFTFHKILVKNEEGILVTYIFPLSTHENFGYHGYQSSKEVYMKHRSIPYQMHAMNKTWQKSAHSVQRDDCLKALKLSNI